MIRASERDDPSVADAGFGPRNSVEHYEIAAYGTAMAIAEQIGQSEVRSILGQTLREEKTADELLTKVCQNELFRDAPKGSELSNGGRSR